MMTPPRPSAAALVAPLILLALAASARAQDAGSADADIDAAVDAAPADATADAGPPPPEDQDAGPPLPDAEAPPAPIAVPEVPVALDLETPADTLRRQITALTPLAEGKPPVEGDIAGLFAVDLRDPEAVAARIETLRRTIDAARAALDPLLARRTAAKAGAAAGLTPEEAARLERLELLTTREGLRLAVLSRPLADRVALLEAEAARLRAASEQAAAEEARKTAEATARDAEQARQSALREAETARSEAARALASARADAEQARAAIAEARIARARRRAARAEAAQRRADLAHRARTGLADGALAPATADAIHQALVDELVIARDDLAAALDALRAPIEAPSVTPAIDLDAAAYRALPLERDAVVRALEAAAVDRAALVAEIEQDRAAAVPATADTVSTLNDLRLRLLPRLSPELREQVLGLGREGLDQLVRELEHLRLMSRWYAHDRRAVIPQVPEWLVDVLGRASTRWQLLELLALALIALPLVWRRRRLLDWLDARIRAWALTSAHGERMRRLWRPLRALAMPLLFYAFVALFFGGLVELIDVPETRLARRVARVMAIYWLVIAVTHYVLVQLASRPGTPVDEKLSARLLRTVRIAGRTAAIIAVFLIVAGTVLGRGYLYTLVRQFAWIAAFPVAWFALRSWQVDIFDAYLAMVPEGTIADLVRRFRTHLLGAFVALPVALWLAARRMVQIAGRWALRLEQVRRALSFLFLRRLEKQATADRAARRDHPPPPDVRAVLERVELDAAIRVERFPRIDEALADLAAWRRGAPGISWAVVGERGAGKSCWIETLAERVGERAVVLRIDRPVPTAAAFCRWLADALGFPDCAADVPGLVAALERGEPRLILLDNTQLCAQRAPGRTAGFEALLDIVRRTHRTAWVCTFSRYLWAWLMFAGRHQDVFRHVATLDRWSEADVGALVDARMAAVGRAVTYEDLMERPDRIFEREEELARTRERYVRLLWDYAEGLPQLVLHFWSRSLVDPGDDGPLRVRLFEVPKPDELEDLRDPARFALHAVVLHAGLSLEDAPAVLQMPPERCLAMLEQLRALGCLARRGDRYGVPIHWHRAVVRFLRRKHLLAG